MFARMHIPSGVKLFDTMNARSELFPAEEILRAGADPTAAPQTQARKCGIASVDARFLRVRTASVSAANSSVPSFASVLCVRL